jgi:hypothetical protein
MNWARQGYDAISLALGQGRARFRHYRDGNGVIAGLRAEKPPSLDEQTAYRESRAWVPTGHEGGVADRAGVFYLETIGTVGPAIGNTISCLTARPLRFAEAFLAIWHVAAAVVALLGDPAAAIWMVAGLWGFLAAAFLVMKFWPARRMYDDDDDTAPDDDTAY